jgi:FtsH-binding integral membrane protein
MNLSISAEQSLNTAVTGVLQRMFLGILATMITAMVITGLGLVPVLFQGVLGYVIVFAPLLVCLWISFRGEQMTVTALRGWFLAFAAIMGVSLSVLFAVYTTGSIVQALVGTTVSFGALAGWGYFTKRDLSGLGPYLMAGVIGLIVASVIGIFLASSVFQMVLNVLAILIFLALTAYDMNRIRDMFWFANADEVERMQWFGALSLYTNFINIFVNMLQLFGTRNE